ncbi:MAG: hypothetical protein U0Z44_04980 [Kouleothrix sp.]
MAAGAQRGRSRGCVRHSARHGCARASGAATLALPQTINLTLNRQDVLVICNDDSQAVQIGPFKIEPGQRFVQQYYNRGTYELMCTIHVAQRMQVIVR